MINDVQLLDSITESADMGKDSLKQLIEKTKDTELKKALESQAEEYEKSYNRASEILKEYGEQPKDANMMAKMNAHMMTNLKTLVSEDPSSKFAELVIEGSTMGVTNMTKKLNEYEGNDHKVKALAEKHVAFEQENIEEMKKFL